MPDVVRKIEITAALSPDYAAAFKHAADIAKGTSGELKTLTQRETDLQKLLALDAQRATAAQAGNLKEAQKSADAYAKLAQRIGVTGSSVEQLSAELKGLGARRKDLESINAAASRRAELGRLAKEIERTQAAYARFKDPALLSHLNAAKRRFSELGGAMPKERQLRALNGIGARLKSIPGPVGQVARSFSGLASMLKGPGGVVAAIAGVGVAAIGAAKRLFSLGLEAAKAGDNIIKTADALGVTTDAYQELSYAMQRGGASEAEFTSALKTLQSQMNAAADGQSRAIKAFAKFGITLDDVRTMNAEEAFYALAEGISKIENPSERMRASLQLLGEGGAKVASAMRGGADALNELRKQGRDTGNVRTRKELENAAKAVDMYTDAQMTLKGAMNDVAYEVMPTVIGVLKDFGAWVRDNRETVRAFAIGAGQFLRGFVSVVSTAFNAASAAIRIVSNGIQYWQDKIASAIGAIVGFGSRIKAVFTETLPAAFTQAKDAIVGIFKSAFDWLNERIQAIVDTFERVKAKITGRNEIHKAAAGSNLREVLERQQAGFPARAGGGPQVAVNLSIDARGGQSYTASDVKRAVDASSGSVAEGVIQAMNRYAGFAAVGVSGGSH